MPQPLIPLLTANVKTNLTLPRPALTTYVPFSFLAHWGFLSLRKSPRSVLRVSGTLTVRLVVHLRLHPLRARWNPGTELERKGSRKQTYNKSDLTPRCGNAKPQCADGDRPPPSRQCQWTVAVKLHPGDATRLIKPMMRMRSSSTPRAATGAPAAPAQPRKRWTTYRSNRPEITKQAVATSLVHG